jgi:hypothetical protein
MAPGHFKFHCEPAATIIRRVGGVRALAKALRVSPEAVSKCNRPVERGGTSGRMPPAWWDVLIPLVEKRGMDGAVVRMRLKLAHRRPKPKLDRDQMVNRAKIKGDNFERQVAADLTAAGVPSHRVPLSGAVPGYAGDVVAEAPDRRWVIQCKINTNKRGKNGEAASQRGRGAIVRFLGQVSFGRVHVGRQSYVAMHQNIFVKLLRDGALPFAANVPEVTVPRAKLVADAIRGHDALIFRRDQQREWYALVLEDRK